MADCAPDAKLCDSKTTDCPRCRAPDAKLCSKCRVVRYCSRECQEKAWHTHKTICRTLVALERDLLHNMAEVRRARVDEARSYANAIPTPCMAPCAYCAVTQKIQSIKRKRTACSGCKIVWYCDAKCQAAHAVTHASECAFMAKHIDMLFDMYNIMCTYVPQFKSLVPVPTISTIMEEGDGARLISFAGTYPRLTTGGLLSIADAAQMLAYCTKPKLHVVAAGTNVPTCVFYLAAKLTDRQIEVEASDIEPDSRLFPTAQHNVEDGLALTDSDVVVSWLDCPTASPISLKVVEAAHAAKSTVLFIDALPSGVGNSKETLAYLEANFTCAWTAADPIVVAIGNPTFCSVRMVASAYVPK